MIFLTIILGVLFAEIAGYWIHVLLHSQKIEFLSRSHMIHHLKAYGPQMPQRPGGSYIGSTDGRAEVLGFGMEWILPIVCILAITWALGWALGFPVATIGAFSGAALFWGYFLFGYMHTSMHLKGFWMEKVPGIRRWYLNIRRLHDIHHLHVSDAGKMDVNYGICFFGFDRVFGSFQPRFQAFNKRGLVLALEKYRFIND